MSSYVKNMNQSAKNTMLYSTGGDSNLLLNESDINPYVNDPKKMKGDTACFASPQDNIDRHCASTPVEDRSSYMP